MQLMEAARLQGKWGGRPCEHEELTREYAAGSWTGDHVCKTCGLAQPMSEWEKERGQYQSNVMGNDGGA